jgi:AcrR family transcriptional regulator
VHTVGIDRIIERAGVAKASLYNTFGSKDELIRAYLGGRHAARQERIAARIATCDTPRAKLLAVFDSLIDYCQQPGYRGCAFLNASAESEPGGVVEQVSDENRRWMRDLLTDLATEAGVTEPEALAGRLVLVYDGANVGARMDRTAVGPTAARQMAELLIDAAR